MKRFAYFMGDIHGCHNECLALEYKITSHCKSLGHEPVFVCVGDLIDRGPESKTVIEHFARGFKKKTHYCIMGNHESEFLRILEAFNPEQFQQDGCQWPSFLLKQSEDFADPLKRGHIETFDEFREFIKTSWFKQGGAETVRSFNWDENNPATWTLPPDLLRYLVSLPLYWQDRDCIVTHALVPREELTTLRTSGYGFLATGDNCKVTTLVPDLSQLRDVDIKNAAHLALWNRRLPYERPDALRVHISGHTPLKVANIDSQLHLIQLDTACVYGGLLTAFEPLSNLFLSVASQTTWKQQ